MRKHLRKVAMFIQRMYSPRFVVIGMRHGREDTAFPARVWAGNHGRLDDSFRFYVKAEAEAYVAFRNRAAFLAGNNYHYHLQRSWEG